MLKRRGKNACIIFFGKGDESDTAASHTPLTHETNGITTNWKPLLDHKVRSDNNGGCHARGSLIPRDVIIIGFYVCLSLVSGLPAATVWTQESAVLREGETETLRFIVQWLLETSSNWQPAYTFQFQSKNYPFYIFDSFNQLGLKVPDQLYRFEIETRNQTYHSLTVDLIIHNVSVEDAGVYEMQLFVSNRDGYRHIYNVKFVDVYTPPRKASCFIIGSVLESYSYEVHCRAEKGSGDATISCIQNNRQLSVKGNVSEREDIVEGVFLIKCRNPISCCSHDMRENIATEMCQDFSWMPTNGDNCLDDYSDDSNDTFPVENVAQEGVQMLSCGSINSGCDWSYYLMSTLVMLMV